MPFTPYHISTIAEITGGQAVFNNREKTLIHDLSTDSRKVMAPETALFFALKGERSDGHHYIPDLYEKGVVNFVVSDFSEQHRSLRANFICVKNTLDALQRLASYHRSQFKIPVAGITGSNGKTVVKEWLYQLMDTDRNIVRSPKSYNSQVGVPLSVWQMGSGHNFAIFEAGISKPGEMEKLAEIIRPDIGLVTNIGQPHDENFTGQEQKIAEKLKLFRTCETLIYCRDYASMDEQVMRAGVLPAGIKLFSWSRKMKASLQIGRVSSGSQETHIQGVYNNDFIEITIPFSDEASIENAIHCWAMMLLLGYENKEIAARMLLLTPVAMRLEMKEGANNCSVINDTYNSDLGSLAIALDFLNQQKQHNKKTVILSDILQSGKNEEALYGEVAEMIARKGVTRLIGIGDAISRQAGQFKTESGFYRSTGEFLKTHPAGQFHDEAILLKGARVFGFEEISKLLQQKTHETILEINLNAVIHNLNYYRARIKPSTRVMAMVKASSYGSGIFEIAGILQFHRVDYLAVAYADEGVELRKAGITLPIMVMNPEEQSLDAIISYSLEPEIYSFRGLTRYAEAVKKHEGNGFPVHLKIDTGMHRLGFEEEDISELIVRMQNHKELKIQSVFSHLAGSDEREHDAFTNEQVERFTQMSGEILRHFPYPIYRHILNSAGILRFPEAQFEMVRIGIGLYGVAPAEHEQQQLQQVASLKTTISQIKNIPAHESIGYSRKAVAASNMQIATVGIGYADGLSRRMSNGAGKMIVNGKFAPVVGNVCMDMCMLDITDIPAQEGDEVTVFGNGYPVTQFAKDLGTIPYEVLTTISRRVKRVYFHE